MSSLTPQRRFIQMNKIPNSTTPSTQQHHHHQENYALIIPREIWVLIGKRLESRLDVLSFRSVCRTWRSVLPPPLRFPLKVPPPPSEISYSNLIREFTFYAANDMIVRFAEERGGGRFSVSTLVHKNGWPISMKLEPTPATQLSKLSFLCNAYDLNYHSFYLSGGIPSNVLKVAILCSDGSVNFNPNYPRLRDLKVIVHLKAERKLAVLSLTSGAMNNSWETGFSDVAFDDIVRYKGQLYGVEGSGRAIVMDYDSLRMTQVAPALFGQGLQGCADKLHLAVVYGELYMFIKLRGFRLYKLSLKLGQWMRADKDLPDHLFVQNEQYNFAVSRDLIRRCHDYSCNGVMKYPLPRFCSWPEFTFVRMDVDFSHELEVCRRRELRLRRLQR